MNDFSRYLEEIHVRLTSIERKLEEEATFASPVLLARCTSNGGEAAAASGLIINYSNIDYDPQSHITTGAGVWKFTAKVAGYYAVSAAILMSADPTLVQGKFVLFGINKNGVRVSNLFYNDSYVSGGTNIAPYAQGSDVVKLAIGDYIQLVVGHNLAGSWNTYSGGSNTIYNRVAIWFVG